MKKRAPSGEANCVVVRHTASDGSKGLHLRAIATMAPGTQLTITSRVGAKFSILRPLYWFSRRFEEPAEATADAMDVDDDNGAAPMLVGRRAPLVVHDGALRAQPSFYVSLPLFPTFSPLTRYDESRTTTD